MAFFEVSFNCKVGDSNSWFLPKSPEPTGSLVGRIIRWLDESASGKALKGVVNTIIGIASIALFGTLVGIAVGVPLFYAVDVISGTAHPATLLLGLALGAIYGFIAYDSCEDFVKITKNHLDQAEINFSDMIKLAYQNR
jgi:hypothetical protein